MPLLEPADCVLIVIDAQPGFYADGLDAADAAGASAALARAAWLTALAVRLEVPVVVTEEDAARNGPTSVEITRHLPPGTPVLDKPTFGLTGSPAIAEAVAATGRGTAVLVGYETDVCVAQSAVGLLQAGTAVVVVDDATFSPGEMHERGMLRALDEGARRDHCKGIAYEWVRTVERSRRILDADPVLNRPPFRL